MVETLILMQLAESDMPIASYFMLLFTVGNLPKLAIDRQNCTMDRNLRNCVD